MKLEEKGMGMDEWISEEDEEDNQSEDDSNENDNDEDVDKEEKVKGPRASINKDG